jgi:hypothetical protein
MQDMLFKNKCRLLTAQSSEVRGSLLGVQALRSNSEMQIPPLAFACCANLNKSLEVSELAVKMRIITDFPWKIS